MAVVAAAPVAAAERQLTELEAFGLQVAGWSFAAAGLVLLATILAVGGYLLVLAGWRAHVVLSWRKRRRRASRPL